MRNAIRTRPPPNHPSRREFVTTMVAGLAVAAGGASAAELPVVEKSVEIKTPDGTCDAAFIHPASGAHPGVLIWPDAFGLRPSMRDIGKRLAAEGYSVLVPNPFYRVAKAPVIADAVEVQLSESGRDRAKLQPLMGSINAAGAAEKDAAAFVALLDAQPQVEHGEEDRHAGLLHGRPARRADRRGGAGSHRRRRVVPRRRARDRQARQPASAGAEDQGADVFRHRGERRHAAAGREDKLQEAFDAAKVPAEIEVYPEAQHGWCVPDMPKQERHADLQQAGRRARLGQADRALQDRARLRTAAAVLTGARV